MRSVRIRGSMVLAAATLLSVVGWAGGASADWRVKTSPAEAVRAYVLYYRPSELRPLYVRAHLKQRLAANPAAGEEFTDLDNEDMNRRFKQDVAEIFAALEAATGKYAAQGFKAPALATKSLDAGGEAKDHLVVVLCGFGTGKLARANGLVRGRAPDGVPLPTCSLLLNARKLLLQRLKLGHTRSFQTTVAHELFHAVQWAYCPLAASWMKEATAVWAANQVYRDRNPHLPDTVRYVRNMHEPMTADDRDANGLYATMQIGRPYGTEVLFRFLNQQTGEGAVDVVKTTLTQSRPYAGQPGHDELTALGMALGDKAALGEKFRGVFGRFATGAFLGPLAPADCRLENVELFADRAGRYPRPDCASLSDFLKDFYQTGVFRSPETALLRIECRGDALADWDGDVGLLSPGDVDIAGCGARYFSLTAPPVAPKDADLQAVVEGGAEEIALAAIAKYGPDVKIIPGQYSAAAGGHYVRLPTLGRITSQRAYLAVCRFSAEEPPKAYNLRLSLAEPPWVKRVAVKQASKVVYEATWAPEGEARKMTAGQSGALEPKAGDAEIEIELSSRIQPGETPICRAGEQTIDTTERQEGLVRVGTIPAGAFDKDVTRLPLQVNGVSRYSVGQAKLPLDGEPTTVARLSPGTSNWTGYEISPAGHLIVLPVGEVPEEAPAVSLRIQPRATGGEEWVLVTCPAFQSVSGEQARRQNHQVRIYVSQSPSGPFRPSASFGPITAETPLLPAADASSNGMISPDTCRVASNGYYAIAQDPATNKTIRPQEKPVYYQAGVFKVLRADSAVGRLGPEGKSNVVGPGKAALRVRNAGPDGKVMLNYLRQEVHLSLSVTDQMFDYHGVKFTVTAGGKTAYGFSPRPGQGAWNQAVGSVKLGWVTAPEAAAVQATGAGQSASASVEVVPDDKALRRYLQEGQKTVDSQNASYQDGKSDQAQIKQLTDAVTRAEEYLQKLRQKTDPAATAQQIQAAQTALAKAQSALQWQGHWQAKLNSLRHQDRIAMAMRRWDEAVRHRQALVQHHDAYATGHPDAGSEEGRKTVARWRLTAWTDLADAAQMAADIGAFRPAVENGVLPALEEGRRLGIVVGKHQDGIEHFKLAEMIAWLQGDQATAKEHFLKYRSIMAAEGSDQTKARLQRDWDTGARPAWWPGD